jgi:hypothetical protein
MWHLFGDDYMSIWTIIPTCADPMSVYTLCAISILVSGGLIAFTLFSRWTSNELRAVYDKVDTIEGCISGHDAYIDATNEVINRIHIDLAVQESSNKSIEKDIVEIKLTLASINKILLDKLTGK